MLETKHQKRRRRRAKRVTSAGWVHAARELAAQVIEVKEQFDFIICCSIQIQSLPLTGQTLESTTVAIETMPATGFTDRLHHREN
jgi:hypothetical protein